MYLLLLVLAVLVLIAIIIILRTPVTITVCLKEGNPIRELDLAQMEQLKRGQLTVYFSSERRNLGKEVADALEQGWRIVGERVGLDLGRFGVAVVVPKADEELGGVRLQRKIWALWDPIVPILTSPNLQSLQQADRDTLISVYWALAHEAMELKVLRKLYRDPAARWVGDGLAEYAGYAITSELTKQVRDEMLAKRRQNVQVLLDQGHKQYDLTKEFLVRIKKMIKSSKDIEAPEKAGYGVALAFWLQIAQRHGEGVIKTFWQRISQRRFPNAKEAARILSELTGEDIWAKLQNMDLQEVLRTLEAAGAGP